MSSLAFDKQGKPFSFLRRTKKLLVRLFRNPSARGTCSQVLTADGQPLHVDPKTDYVEFRKAVGHLYRLDQCDENGAELDDAQAAYVAIDIARNASAGVADGSTASEVNPLVIIEHLVAIQADAMKTMVAKQAAIMAAQAEIMRAPYRPAPPAPAPAPRNAQPEDEDVHEHDDAPVAVESPWAVVIREALPMFQMLGGIALVVMQQKFLPGTAIAMPNFGTEMSAMPGMAVPMPGMVMPGTAAPTSVAPVAHASVSSGEVPVHAASAPATAACSHPAAGEAIASNVLDDDAAGIARIGVGGGDAGTASTLVASAPANMAGTSPTGDAPPVLQPQQFAHVLAIRARLQPDETAFADLVIARMAPEQRAQWITALSAMSLDDATATIRTTIAQLRKPRT